MNVGKFWEQASFIAKTVIVIYIASFAGASYNHVSDMVHGGFFPYQKWTPAPFGFHIYWMALTVLDPLCIFVLIKNVHIGTVMYFILILSDVAINVFDSIVYRSGISFFNFRIVCQIVFLLFVILTAKFLIKQSKRKI